MLNALIAQGLLTCPSCRGWRDGAFINAPLRLGEVWVERQGRPQQGLLRCTGCGVAHPILDGVAVIVRDTGAWLRASERPVMWRGDLAPGLERWLRGAWSEEEDPNWRRQMMAIYSRALEGPASEAEEVYEARRAALVQGDLLALDAGCGAGQATLSLARLGARVVAVDLDFGPLRALATLLEEGVARVPRWRHGGGDFTTAELRLPEGVSADRVALIAADMMDPPFAAGGFDLACCYHLLDNVPEPVKLVRQLHGALRPGGRLALASPYDWSPRATPIAARLGESISAQGSPDPAQAMRALLTGGLPQHAPELAMELLTDLDGLPWSLERHARSVHTYRCHYVEARRPAVSTQG